MLDVDSFDPRQREISNRPPDFFHYTLLHELGHVVDFGSGALRGLRRADRPSYRAVVTPPRAHRGITQGVGEHFADLYADYFFYSEAERPTAERMDALLRSPAFAGISAPRRAA
jgi:hypothetical protein